MFTWDRDGKCSDYLLTGTNPERDECEHKYISDRSQLPSLLRNNECSTGQSCKKAAGMRVPPVRKVYHAWGHWGSFQLLTNRSVRNKKPILKDIIYIFLQFESPNSHYFEEDLKTWNFTRRKVEHFLQLCNRALYIKKQWQARGTNQKICDFRIGLMWTCSQFQFSSQFDIASISCKRGLRARTERRGTEIQRNSHVTEMHFARNGKERKSCENRTQLYIRAKWNAIKKICRKWSGINCISCIKYTIAWLINTHSLLLISHPIVKI